MLEPDVLPQLKVNGKLTWAKNTADNGGMCIAFLALIDTSAAQVRTTGEKRNGYIRAGPSSYVSHF